jgi:ribonuclease-3 family protein
VEESLVKMYSPLALAYIGDSIYDLMVKKHFVIKSNMQPEKYHKVVTSIVSANAQSAFIDSYMDKLTEKEQAVYKRGRNSSPHTKAKNASLENYLKATGFEAVLGYLYLSEQEDRLKEIIDESINFVVLKV